MKNRLFASGGFHLLPGKENQIVVNGVSSVEAYEVSHLTSSANFSLKLTFEDILQTK